MGNISPHRLDEATVNWGTLDLARERDKTFERERFASSENLKRYVQVEFEYFREVVATSATSEVDILALWEGQERKCISCLPWSRNPWGPGDLSII